MNDDKRCCKNCKAGGYVLSLDKVSCSHTENYQDPNYVCDLYRKRGNNPEDIVDNILDGSNELDDYLNKQRKDILTKIISTMFEMHSYTDDPIRIFYMTSIVINRFVINLLEFFQDMSIETLTEYGIIADFTKVGEMKKKMK